MNAIVPRATIEDVVRYRNKAVELYHTAYDRLEEAQAAVRAANEVAAMASPGINNFTYNHADEISAFKSAISLPPREQYLRTASRIIDLNAWAWVIERSELEKLMDTEAKKVLRDQMAYVSERIDRRSGELLNSEEISKGMPPLTVENITATLEQFLGNAGFIFRRGIANCFSKLDRRFRSHDGFKIGSRIILTHVFDDWGHLRYGNLRDTLIDIERVFSVMDGHPESSFTSALNALEQQRRGSGGKRQSELETEYFKIRGFKNGNAHLWFNRDDLLEKVNKLLAEFYGEVIGDGQQAEEDPLANIKHTPAKRYGFFPTPDPAVDFVFRKVSVMRDKAKERMRILEPSAGTGQLARRCFSSLKGMDEWQRERYGNTYRYDNLVDVVELQHHLAEGLRAEGIYNRVMEQNFLTLTPETTGLYDLVVMNPPFDRERDIDHVVHAFKFLKPDGQLVAIMSAGTELRETKKSIAFRNLVEKFGGAFEDMPAGSFAESGTYINTTLLRMNRNGKKVSRW